MADGNRSRAKTTLRVALGIAVVGLLVAGAVIGVANWLEGQSQLTFVVKETETSAYDAEIAEDDVETRLPAFHRLLEQAHQTGAASTTDEDLIEEIWAYLDEMTGEQQRGPVVLYNGKTFEIDGLAQ